MNNNGEGLKEQMEDSKVRALLRAQDLQKRGNAQFNILTGQGQNQITVPHHARYNPMANAGAQMVQDSYSRGSS
jgi:hypothetical protein